MINLLNKFKNNFIFGFFFFYIIYVNEIGFFIYLELIILIFLLFEFDFLKIYVGKYEIFWFVFIKYLVVCIDDILVILVFGYNLYIFLNNFF